jgi:alpha,alpha-trehalose phosphorylase
MDILVETARLWRGLGHHDREGQFRIDGVTGPDEYSALGDNNVYTNLMAQQNLEAAASAVERHQDEAAALNVGSEEAADWRSVAAAIRIPYDEHLGVHPQAEQFTEHQVWDFAATGPDEYPMLLHFPYFDLYRKQVVKQADLVLALHLRGDAFDDEQKARDFAYYERLTVRDSSLSAATQSVIAAEVGHLDLAYDYLAEAALIDLRDLDHDTRNGLHIAALAGGWTALVAGFGGLRRQQGTLGFAPRLPDAITRIGFNLYYRDRRLHVAATAKEATYTLHDGDPIDFLHYGKPFTLTTDDVVRRRIPKPPTRPRPTQPHGREPARRRART